MSVGIKDKIEIQTLNPNAAPTGSLYHDPNKGICQKTASTNIPLASDNLTTPVFGVLTVGTSFPSSPQECDLFYNSTNRQLFRYKGSNWVEIDWQRIVRTGPEWRANRLRIQTNNQLQISPNGSNWFDCIPAVGARSIEIQSYDNTGYSQLYYIMPGTTAIIRNANHLPIVFSQAIRTRFNIETQGSIQYEDNIGLRINNTTVTGGDIQLVAGQGTSIGAARSTSLNIFPLSNNSNTTTDENRFNGTIHIIGQEMVAQTLNLYFQLHGTCMCTGQGTMTTLGYWLGTWFTQAGTQFSVQSVSIERMT